MLNWLANNLHNGEPIVNKLACLVLDLLCTVINQSADLVLNSSYAGQPNY